MAEELDSYLERAVAQRSDRIEPPPEKLRRYLAANGTALEAIASYALKEDVPQWGTDIIPFSKSHATVAKATGASQRKQIYQCERGRKASGTRGA